MAAMQHDDGLLEDLKFDEELEGFLSGTGPSSGMVDLQPQPTSFGNTFDGLPEPGAAPEAKAAAESSTASKAIGLAAAAFGSAAGALMGGEFWARASRGGSLPRGCRCWGSPSTGPNFDQQGVRPKLGAQSSEAEDIPLFRRR